MIDELRPYPEYRESGGWLERLPAGWDVLVLKRVMRSIVERDAEPPESDRYVALEHVEGWTGRIQTGDDAPTDSQLKRFRAGDILFGKLRPYLAKVSLASFDGQCVGEFLVLRPTTARLQSSYLERVLRSAGAIHAVNAMTDGAKMPRAEWRDIGLLPVPVPPPADQAAIVRYLDHVDLQIEQFVATKERLIRLLEEEKQATTHRAVTRGLDPGVPFKPSGVDWLGDIPGSWDLTRAKWAFREVDERSATGQEELLSVSHLTGVTPRAQKDVTMFEPESYVGHKLCRPGDLVVNTMWAWMGALGASDRVGIVSPSYAVYRPIGDGFRPAYVERLLRTRVYVDEFMRRSTGIRPSRRRLYPPQLLTVPLLHPPLDEQDRILDAIATHPTGHALGWAQREIELAREYRIRLTSDVVTGKLDAREAAAKLPAETDRQDPALDHSLEAAAAA